MGEIYAVAARCRITLARGGLVFATGSPELRPARNSTPRRRLRQSTRPILEASPFARPRRGAERPSCLVVLSSWSVLGIIVAVIVAVAGFATVAALYRTRRAPGTQGTGTAFAPTRAAASSYSEG